MSPTNTHKNFKLLNSEFKIGRKTTVKRKTAAKRTLRTKKNAKLEWEDAIDVKEEVEKIVNVLEMDHILIDRIFCYRTEGSKAKAYARTWMMPKIFQDALNIPPAYVIEVISKYFDKLNHDDQSKVLIHELLHIPKNFSGALLSHHGVNRHIAHDSNALFKEYKKRVEKL